MAALASCSDAERGLARIFEGALVLFGRPGAGEAEKFEQAEVLAPIELQWGGSEKDQVGDTVGERVNHPPEPGRVSASIYLASDSCRVSLIDHEHVRQHIGGREDSAIFAPSPGQLGGDNQQVRCRGADG